MNKKYRISKTTALVTVRLPLAVNEILERRAKNHKGGVSGYARDRLTYDLTRKHHKRNGSK